MTDTYPESINSMNYIIWEFSNYNGQQTFGFVSQDLLLPLPNNICKQGQELTRLSLLSLGRLLA
jgi:hypothetical protein